MFVLTIVTIGGVAREAGVGVETVRFHERSRGRAKDTAR